MFRRGFGFSRIGRGGAKRARAWTRILRFHGPAQVFLGGGRAVVAVQPGRREAQDFGGRKELELGGGWRDCPGGVLGFADKIEGHPGEKFRGGRGGDSRATASRFVFHIKPLSLLK